MAWPIPTTSGNHPMRNNPLAPAITGDLMRLTIGMTGPSGLWVVIQDYMANALGVITSATVAAFPTDAKTALEPTLKNCLSDQVTISSYGAACLNLANPASSVLSNGTVGTVAQAPLPSEVAVNVIKNSLLKGQHGRGRMQLPGIPVTFTTPATSPDLLNVTGTGLYALFATQLKAGFTSSGIPFTPVIASRPVPPATLYSLAVPVNNFGVDIILGTQRRRKRGRGQ